MTRWQRFGLGAAAALLIGPRPSHSAARAIATSRSARTAASARIGRGRLRRRAGAGRRRRDRRAGAGPDGAARLRGRAAHGVGRVRRRVRPRRLVTTAFPDTSTPSRSASPSSAPRCWPSARRRRPRARPTRCCSPATEPTARSTPRSAPAAARSPRSRASSPPPPAAASRCSPAAGSREPPRLPARGSAHVIAVAKFTSAGALDTASAPAASPPPGFGGADPALDASSCPLVSGASTSRPRPRTASPASPRPACPTRRSAPAVW